MLEFLVASCCRFFQTVELHISGVGEDMTEEDIRRICTVDPSAGSPEGARNTQLRSSGGNTKAENVRRGPAGCVMRICLATDLLTSKCKGTGKILLR